MVKSVSPSGDSKVNLLFSSEMFLARYIGFSYLMPHSHSNVPHPEMNSFISMSLPHQHGFVDTLQGSSSSPKLIASPLKSISLKRPTIVGSSLLYINVPLFSSIPFTSSPLTFAYSRKLLVMKSVSSFS